MNETSWRLKLDTKGARGAKVLARDLRELDAALKAVGESAHVLKSLATDAAALRGARVRIQAERRVGDESVRQQARVDRERRQSIADRRREDAGINRASDRAAREDARLARQAERVALSARTQRRRDDEGIARASQRADREDMRVSQRAARLNAGAFRRDQAASARTERTEQRRIERIAKLNSQAFRRDGVEQTRQARRREVQSARTLATNRREWRETQQARSEGWSDALKSAGMVLGVMGAISAATIGALSVITDMIGAVGALVFRISSAVLEMIAFREASLTTLRALARDEHGNRLTGGAANAQAHERLRFAQTFARQTPLDTEQVVGLQRQTTAAGFNGRRNEEVVRAAADVGALRADDPGASSRFLTQLGQIHNSSTLRTADFRPAAQAAGLNESEILRRIATSTGVTQRHGEADTAFNSRLQAMQSGGRFTGAQGEDAILSLIRERSGGELGQFAREQGNTLTGTFSNLRGAVFDFVTSIEDIENLPGIRALKSLLNSVVESLTGTGPVAKRLRQDFAGIVDTVSGLVARIGGSGKGGVEGTLGRVLDMAEQLVPVVLNVMGAFGGAAWSSFVEGLQPLLAQFSGGGAIQGTEQWVVLARQLGSAFGTLLAFGVRVTVWMAELAILAVAGAGALIQLVQWVGTVAQSFADALASPLATLFPHIGVSIVDGITDGFRSRAGGFITEISTWGTGIADSVKGALGIQSPSKVFRDEVGVMIPRGVALGIDSGAHHVERALSGMVAPQGLPGFGAGLGGGLAGLGGGGISAVFQITVQGGGSSAETGREIGEASWAAFVDRFERVGAMQGA